MHKFIIIILLLGIVSCSDSNSEDKVINTYPELKGHSVDIKFPSGSLIEHQGINASIPSFFPSGYFNNEIFTIVLANEKATSKRLGFKELGLLEIELKDTIINVLVAKPINEDFSVVESDDYNEFSLQYAELKHLLELWYKTNCRNSSCKSVKWENDFKARIKIQQSLSN